MPIFPVTKLPTPPVLPDIILPFDADQKKIYDFTNGEPQRFQIRSEFDGKNIKDLTENDVKIKAPTNGTIKELEIIVDKNDINAGTNVSGININLVVGGTSFLLVNFPNKDGTNNGLGKFIGTTTVSFNKDDTLWLETDIDDGVNSGGNKIESSSINYMYTVLP